MTSPLKGEEGSAKRWCYYIILFSKMGDKGKGGSKISKNEWHHLWMAPIVFHLSIEYKNTHFLKLDGKVKKIWPLFFHRIWKYDDPLLSFLTATHQQQLCLNWDYFLSIWSNLHIQSISVMLEYYQKKLFYLCNMSGLARIPVMKVPYFLFKNGSISFF